MTKQHISLEVYEGDRNKDLMPKIPPREKLIGVNRTEIEVRMEERMIQPKEMETKKKANKDALGASYSRKEQELTTRTKRQSRKQ